MEGVDNPDVDDLRDIALGADARFELADEGGVAGIPALVAEATVLAAEGLFVDARDPQRLARTTTLTAIPYYAWANRGPSPMAIWLNREPERGGTAAG